MIADVNLGDVMEVLDIRLRPSDHSLKRSVYFVLLPSAQYGGVFAAFLYSSVRIHGFLMINLPLVVSALSHS